MAAGQNLMLFHQWQIALGKRYAIFPRTDPQYQNFQRKGTWAPKRQITHHPKMKYDDYKALIASQLKDYKELKFIQTGSFTGQMQTAFEAILRRDVFVPICTRPPGVFFSRM